MSSYDEAILAAKALSSKKGLDIQITQTESEGGNGTVPVLCANIPVKDLRKRS